MTGQSKKKRIFDIVGILLLVIVLIIFAVQSGFFKSDNSNDNVVSSEKENDLKESVSQLDPENHIRNIVETEYPEYGLVGIDYMTYNPENDDYHYMDSDEPAANVFAYVFLDKKDTKFKATLILEHEPFKEFAHLEGYENIVELEEETYLETIRLLDKNNISTFHFSRFYNDSYVVYALDPNGISAEAIEEILSCGKNFLRARLVLANESAYNRLIGNDQIYGILDVGEGGYFTTVDENSDYNARQETAWQGVWCKECSEYFK